MNFRPRLSFTAKYISCICSGRYRFFEVWRHPRKSFQRKVWRHCFRLNFIEISGMHTAWKFWDAKNLKIAQFEIFCSNLECCFNFWEEEGFKRTFFSLVLAFAENHLTFLEMRYQCRFSIFFSELENDFPQALCPQSQSNMDCLYHFKIMKHVTADSNPNNWFKLLTVLGPSSLPVTKQQSSFERTVLFADAK